MSGSRSSALQYAHDAGLVHRARGKPSNRRFADEFRKQVMDLVLESDGRIRVLRASQWTDSGDDDQIIVRDILPCGLTFDHRAVDGGPIGDFTRKITDLLSNPELMLL